MKNRILSMLLLAAAMLLTACKGTSVPTSGDAPGYPMPTPEEECCQLLQEKLTSDEGRAMTAVQLASLSLKTNIHVALPVADEDVLPQMGTYTDTLSGGTITFMPYTNEKDTVAPICQAALHVAIHAWEDRVSSEAATDTLRVQNRGNGILSLYRIVHGGGPNGGKHRCYDKHPDGYPEYRGQLMYVYPGADSLMVSSGYERSLRVYHYNK